MVQRKDNAQVDKVKFIETAYENAAQALYDLRARTDLTPENLVQMAQSWEWLASGVDEHVR